MIKNMYLPKHKGTKYIKKLMQLLEEKDNSMIAEYFNTSLSIINKTTIQKINKDTK
jgi:hypothetical protein